MWVKYTYYQNNLLSLQKDIMINKEIILGMLLGDASIYKYDIYYRLHCEHSRKQEDFLLWKKSQLGIDSNYYKRNRTDIRTGKTYYSCSIHKQSKEFKYYYDLFYPTGPKSINEEILKGLTNKSIAIWYMDDGNIYTNNDICHLNIATHSFSKQCRLNIINYFKNTWNVSFKESSSGSIRLTSKKEVIKFLDIIRPYIHISMEYKCPAIKYK